MPATPTSLLARLLLARCSYHMRLGGLGEGHRFDYIYLGESPIEPGSTGERISRVVCCALRFVTNLMRKTFARSNILHRCRLLYNLDLGLSCWFRIFCWCLKSYKIYLL
jgi:hypothetical protein